MLVRYKISTVPRVLLLHNGILRRENIENCYLAVEIVDAAHAQTTEIMLAAQSAAAALRQQIHDEIAQQLWQQAQQLLSDWQSERIEMQDSVVKFTKELLTQVLRIAFSDKSVAAHNRILIKHLEKFCIDPTPALLIVNQTQLAATKAYLMSQQNDYWKVVGDSNQEKDSLRLKSANGNFTLRWQALTEQYLSAIAEHPLP